MAFVDSWTLTHPVYIARPQADGNFDVSGEIEGTCFSIGADVMLTAGHVVTSIQEGESRGLQGVMGILLKNGEHKGLRIVDHEVLACDIGLVKVAPSAVVPQDAIWCPKWSAERMQPVTDVRCVGYAYGLQRTGSTNPMVIQRAFKGYVVAALHAFAPVGYSGRPFAAYELSFAAPRGLSGAPVLASTDQIEVTGIVIGNSQSRMLILESEDFDITGATMSHYSQFESLTLGVAVQLSEVLPQTSRLLGTSVLDSLNRQSKFA